MDSSSRAMIQVGPIQVDFLVEADDSSGSVTVFECHVPADARVPVPHSHNGFEETIYGLEGVCTCIRRGQIHGFENRGSIDAKFLAIATPGVFGPAYFQEISDVLAASAGGPPNQAAIAEVMRRHGLTPAPPITT